MKRLKQVDRPAALADEAKLREWYDDLRYPSGSIRPRWNEELPDGSRPVRDPLEEKSENCCTWCGTALGGGLTVDHYLPKEKFPRLAYCWSNLLPACGNCNLKLKNDYSPGGLSRDSLYDPVLGAAPGEVYHPDRILPKIADRLVDPGNEDPAQHLQFHPEAHSYLPRTGAGTRTIQKMFSEKDYAKGLDELSCHVKSFVEHPNPEVPLDTLVKLGGRSFYVEAYATFWGITKR